MSLTKVTYSMIDGSAVNVKDFGASPSATASENKAAFEAALAAGSVVVIPADGTYSVNLISIPSNKTIIAYGAIVTNTTTGDAGIFSIAAGVSNVKIIGGSYRGPAFGGTPVPAPAYPASNGCVRITGTYNNVCSDITIQDAEIAGWNDYGIFAENVLRGAFNNNHIHTIGRDGVRTYGAVLTDVSHNHIHDITPGFAGVAPNLNAYGITFTRNPTNEGTPLVNHPPSSYCTANNNLIEDIPTWKGLDTHGGVNIVFSSNIVRNCRFGIGIDEGDTSGLQNAPPINITVADNIFTLGAGNAGEPCINAVSTSASNLGSGLSLTNNTIIGFGGSGTGAINIAYFDDAKIVSNTIIDSAVCAINFPGSTTTTNVLIDSNIIKNLTGSVLAGIAVQSGSVAGFIKGGLFIETNGSAYDAISLGSPSSGFGFEVSDDLYYEGSVTKWATNALGRVVGGGVITQAKAYAKVNSAGTLQENSGVASAVKDATGEYTVTLEDAFLSLGSIVPSVTSRAAAPFFVRAEAISTTEIKVLAWDSSGIASDCAFSLIVHGR